MLSTVAAISLFAAAAQAGKRGLAWPYYNGELDPGVFSGGQVSHIYDWETYAPPSTNGDGGLSFIGRQRCTDCDSSPIGELAARASDQGWEAVFTLNEPDTGATAAADAAQWYKDNINGLGPKKALPAITSSGSDGQGLSWLQAMVDACAGGCTYDYIDLHWYGPDFGGFQSHIEAAHTQFPDTKIVITEFALQAPAGGQADQINFFKEAFSWLDGQDYVEMYFPFVATTPSLLSSNDAAGAGYVGTGSCLYDDGGAVSAVGQLLLA